MTKHDDNKTIEQEEIEEQADEISVEEELVSKEEQLQEQLVEAENKYKRALADYQNLEKRMVDERRVWIRQANSDLLHRILPVLDTLMLAQKHSTDKSLSISVQQFLDILKSEGVTKIESVGNSFDPGIMEAVGTSEGEDGKVIDEARAGFMLHDRLLRPAQVLVGSKN